MSYTIVNEVFVTPVRINQGTPSVIDVELEAPVGTKVKSSGYSRSDITETGQAVIVDSYPHFDGSKWNFKLSNILATEGAVHLYVVCE